MKTKSYFKQKPSKYFGSHPKPISRPRRNGRISQSEKVILTEIVKDFPSALVPAQIHSTAIMLNRTPETIAKAIDEARARLADQALEYVDIHMSSTRNALADRDHDVARKAAEWALEHISAKDTDGKQHRIIDVAESSSTAPRIQIGIALGGLPGRSN